MDSNSPQSQYPVSLRRFHWTQFALVLLAYVFINTFQWFPRGSAVRSDVLGAHFLAGLAVLLLVLPRLLARLRKGRPPVSPTPPIWIERVGRITHVALYLFLFIQPILGIITLQIGGKPVSLFGVTLLPSFVAHPDKALSHQFEYIHGTLGEVFYYVIGLHILAALWHHYWRHDNTLKRML
ncbi:MAG: cytochrome b [Rhodanobacteraceae bacterium]